MPKRPTTSQRGYGHRHQQERKRLEPIVEAGNGWCTEPRCLMQSRWIPPGSAWDLAHGDTRDTYRGPAHSLCNRSEGSKRARRGDDRPWLAKGNHTCPVCGGAVAWATSRCCSRECAARLRVIDRAPPPPTEHTCRLCAATFTGRKRAYCSDACMWESNARQARDRYRTQAGINVDTSEPTTPRRRWAL